jgi:hypothetical protein
MHSHVLHSANFEQGPTNQFEPQFRIHLHLILTAYLRLFPIIQSYALVCPKILANPSNPRPILITQHTSTTSSLCLSLFLAWEWADPNEGRVRCYSHAYCFLTYVLLLVSYINKNWLFIFIIKNVMYLVYIVD